MLQENTIELPKTNKMQMNVKLFLTYVTTLFMLFLFFYPILTRANIGASYYIFSFTIIFIFAAFSLTLNLEVGFLGIPNFGKVAFIAIGGYSYAITTEKIAEHYHHGDPYLFGLVHYTKMWLIISGLIYATIITGIFGALLTLPTIKLREDFLAIVTIVAGEIVRYVANNEEFFHTFSGFSVENPVYDKYSPDTVMRGLFISGSQFGIFLLIIGFTAIYYQFAIRTLSNELRYLIDLRYQRIVTWNIMASILIMFLEFLGIWGEPSIGLHILLILNIVFFIVYRNYGQEKLSFYGPVILSTGLALISFVFSITSQEIVIPAMKIDTQVNIKE